MANREQSHQERAQVSYYDDFSAGYDRYYAEKGWWAAVEAEELVGRFALRAGDVVADIGCGTGRLIPYLAEHAAVIYAVDNSPASIGVLRQKCQEFPWGQRVNTAVGSMADPLELPSDSCDKIISCQAFQYVTPQSRRAALGEFKRVLKPGGRLFIEVFAHPGWIYRLDEPKEGHTQQGVYFRCYARDELASEVTENGLRVLGVHPIVRWPQLRHFGQLGRAIELMASRLPTRNHTRCGYWLLEAERV